MKECGELLRSESTRPVLHWFSFMTQLKPSKKMHWFKGKTLLIILWSTKNIPQNIPIINILKSLNY